MRQKIPLAFFLPDQSKNSGALIQADNVIPIADGYRPVPQFSGFSAALGAAFAGGASFIAQDGVSNLLVGTATGLLKYASGTSWTALLSAMTVTGRWRFTQFGNYAIAVNGVGTKVVNLSTGVASALAGAPVGVCVATVGGFVVIGQDTGNILRVWNSKVEDHTGWTAGVGGAGFTDMLTGGEVMGIAGGEYGIVLQKQRLVRMNRTGDTVTPFSFDEITPNVGCASKGSIAQAGNTVFFLSDRGFMALQAGQDLQPIGDEKFDRWFREKLDRTEWEKIYATVDPENKLVMWAVPGSPGFILVYHYELGRASTISLNLDGLFFGATSSVSLEALAALYPNLDTMTISLDDPRWSGGSPQLFIVQGGVVGSLFGAALKATLEYGWGEPTPGRVTRFRGLRPVTDAVAGMTASLDCRMRMGDAENVRSVTELRASGSMPIRHSGRYAAMKLQIAAGTDWDYVQGLELEMEAGGQR